MVNKSMCITMPEFHPAEWTKENTRDTYILIKNKAQKERAIKFYSDLGFILIKGDLYTKSGTIYTGKEGIYADINWRPANKRKINPFYKPRRKFPREMLVSDDNAEWTKRLTFGKVKEFNYVTLNHSSTSEALKSWKYAKEID